ncbi:MAG TPA: hypothetical protein VFS08_05105 [Gemmatimonadaceae bacterium]|nr:hypothetical protein [Gemmatimonadaceae bacterium]
MAFAGSSGRAGGRPGTRQRGAARDAGQGRGEGWRTARPTAVRARTRGEGGGATTPASRGRPFTRDVDWPRFGAAGAGLALGTLLGAGLALLLAPHSGADTRRMLRRAGRRTAVRASDVWDDLGEELRHATYRSRKRLRRGLRRSRWRAQDLFGGGGGGSGGGEEHEKPPRRHRRRTRPAELEIELE